MIGLHRKTLLALSVSIILSARADAAQQCFTGDTLVPDTTEGLYVNLVTGISGPSEGSVPGFDVDIYAAANSAPSGQLKFYWGAQSTGGAGVASVGDTYAVLGAEQLIGPDSVFTRAAFTGITTAWQAGVTGYLGLRFRNEAAGNAIHYGWLRLSTTAPLGFPATIRGWCYEDSGAPISTPMADVLLRDGFEG